MPPPAPAPETWRAANTDITTLERQLSNLWKKLAAQSPTSYPVRTHLFNLVAFAGDQASAQRIARLDEMCRHHASRAIILVSDRSHRNSSVDGEITVQCTSGGDGSSSLCYEVVQLTVHGRAADHLSSIVIPLLIPQIPTFVWWPGQPLFGHRLFHRMLSVADQLIVDSAQFESPGDGLASLRRLSQGALGINDFNWGRLAAWRDTVSQFFDNPAMLPYLSGVRGIPLEFGAGESKFRGVTAGALLLLGWMCARLNWRPETTLETLVTGDVTISVLQGERLIPIQLQFADHGTGAASRLMGIEIVSQLHDRPPARFRVRRSDRLQTVEVSAVIHGEPEISRVLPLSIPSEEALLAEELSYAGHDPLFESTLLEASRLAGREVFLPV